MALRLASLATFAGVAFLLTSCGQGAKTQTPAARIASAPLARIAQLEDGSADGQGPRIPIQLPTGRSYELYVPKVAASGGALPLVVNLHAYLTTDGLQAALSRMDPIAEERGYLVAYPQARLLSWNGGSCCGEAMLRRSDDVGFVRDVVADVAKRLRVDPSRVYATGMSNGGFLAHRLGCEAADLFAAIAPVAGVIGMSERSCEPSRPMPMLHVHGRWDPVIAYNGLVYRGAPETMAFWAQRNACSRVTSRIEFSDGHCETRVGCREGASVTLCTADRGLHCWPGNPICPGGRGNNQLDANRVIFDFFADHRLHL
jgi:polyhydroxybutyrate depolymerase